MSATVLIVDDSLTVRMDLLAAFETAGFRCTPCATAAEAREALAAGPVNLVILDVLLPDADGIEFLDEIRTTPHGAEAAVLMLSTEADVKDRIRGLKTGADDYVGKPYDTTYMVSRARQLLRNRHGTAAPGAAILLIDDSATFREELRRALEPAGYRVLSAASGEEGLRLAADHRPHAILVDGILPGIDGATVIRRIRLDAALRGVPCVLLTASDDAGAELRALDAGADAFVRKGEDIGVILARLEAVQRSRVVEPGDNTASSLSGPKKILAVDDSSSFLHALGDALRSDGYDVVLAQSGEEALEMLAVQPVDCILLDLVMTGIDGRETCRRIKSVPVVRDIPLLMLTALEDRQAMIDGLSTGADDYIAKSSDFEVLRARIRAQLRRKQSEAENRRIRDELLRKEREASEARAARQLAETRAAMVEELEQKNRELEAFSYSVSHDLRAPLRAIDGFSQALIESSGHLLETEGKGHIERVRTAAKRMGELIDDLLALSHVGRTELRRGRVDLSEVAGQIVEELRAKDPRRCLTCDIEEGLIAHADSRLMRIVLENLLGNAWKFTSRAPSGTISFGAKRRDGGVVYEVRDNGAGFDATYADKLFLPFQRLHSESEFPGTGIGLAIVRRIIDRHGGMVWAEGSPGSGATVFFTIGPARGIDWRLSNEAA